MEIRSLRPDEFQTYLALFRRCFTSTLTDTQLRQKIFPIPLDVSPLTVVAVSSGVFVGSLSLYPVPCRCHGERLWAGQHGDAMVAPEARKQGLFKKMIAEIEGLAAPHGFDFLLTFPSTRNLGSHQAFRSTGYQSMEIQRHIRIQLKSAALFPRILRRCSRSLYRSWEKTTAGALNLEECIPLLQEDGTETATLEYSQDFFQYKSLFLHSFRSIEGVPCLIGHDLFEIKVGPPKLDSTTAERLVPQLRALGRRFAKDTLTFIAGQSDLESLRLDKDCYSVGEFDVMIKPISESGRMVTRLSLPFFAYDTF